MSTRTKPRRELKLARAKAAGLFRSVAVLSIFSNLLMLTGPLFMLQVYDRVLGSRSEETLVALFGLVAVLFTAYGLIEYSRGRVMARVGARLQAAFGPRVFDAVIRASARRTQGASSALQSLEAVKGFYTSPVVLALFDAPWTPLFIAAIFIFHPLLGWLAIAGALILFIVAVTNQLVTRARVLDAQDATGAANRLAKSAQDGSALLWAQGMIPAMQRRWIKKQDEALDRTIRANDWTGSFTSFSKAFRFFLQSAVLALGALLVLQGEITAGAMIAASILLGRALAPVEQSLAQWPVVQRARAGWTALDQLLQEIPDHPEPMALPAPEARLTVKDVNLLLRPDKPPILHGIDFELAPGEALGIIGRSGSGKTTLGRLCIGLTPPSTGEIRLGGATLDQYGSNALGKYIGYLPQDISLFDGTIAENIAQMDETPDADKVVAAAQKAQIHDIILKLPDGYDTRVFHNDGQLSGGQMQRVALARALYNEPVVLVLDEPNSALDAEGSEALNKVVRDMKAAGHSVLIMTHRPTAISACDRLLVLNFGTVIAQGSRDEVIKSMMRNADGVQRVVGRGAST